MLDRYPGGKEALLAEVRAGRTSPEVAACVLAGQIVCGAPLNASNPNPNPNPYPGPDPDPSPNPNPDPSPILTPTPILTLTLNPNPKP
jgi:hypothetical protein